MAADSEVVRRDHVQSIDRVFAVLTCFTAGSPSLSLSAVAERTGLDRSAARRYLLTLERLGYVGRQGQRFALRPKILEIGYGYLASLSLPQVAQPHLAELVTRVEESCAVTVLDGTEIAYVAVQNAARGLSITLTIGNRLPAYCTAMGRVLMAGLPDHAVRELLSSSDHCAHTTTTVIVEDEILAAVAEARRVGWAVVDQELENGVRSVAVPIHNAAREVVAAASISVPASRVTLPQLRGPLRDELRRTVQEIEAGLPQVSEVGSS